MTPAARDVLSALRALAVDGEFSGPVNRIAEKAGVHKVTCVKALQALVEEGKIAKSGGERRVNSYRVLSGSVIERNDDGYQIQKGEPEEEGAPGQEYTRLGGDVVVQFSHKVAGRKVQLADRDQVVQQRAIDCARMGRGPKWLVELGRTLLSS